MVEVTHGPLAGVRIVELGAVGPVPLAGMLLADLGCDVVRVRREGPDGSSIAPGLYRGRSEVTLDLTSVADRERALELIALADGVIEGFRVGLLEQVGIDPERCLARNPGLVFARVSGWGMAGPLANRHGNDINHLALTGALHMIGTPGMPIAPLNILGEYGGGALFLALGVVSGILSAQATGRGQIIDSAQVDGVGAMLTLYHALLGSGRWVDGRWSNLVDGAAPFYRCYACRDGRHVAVGALEPPTFAQLCDALGIPRDRFRQYDRASWAPMAETLAKAFATRSRDEWAAHFMNYDACVTPVLSLAEAPAHPHNQARASFAPEGKGFRPAPAPRFLGSPAEAVPSEGVGIDEVLARWG